MTNDPNSTLPGDPNGTQPRVAVRPDGTPERIGPFAVVRELGRGTFGTAYLARDEELDRFVAIKVPRAELLGGDLSAYRNEARAVAALDHPNIVGVYSIGSAPEFPLFVVSKYVEGETLADLLLRARPGPEAAARMVAALAAALHHAHEQKIVHRDVKPGNLMVDRAGTPFVLDFGLALRESDATNEARASDARVYLGTPAYMSPEQARGEGHRVDRRSDVFSLGAVFYELLTGTRPFPGPSVTELLAQVANTDPPEPRARDERVPKELNRICMRALARRLSDRYATAAEFADDLNFWLSPLAAGPAPGSGGGAEALPPGPPAPPAPTDAPLGAFIAHSSTDAAEALQLVGLLESRGVRCWIAPRDVVPGDDYRESILKALDAVPVVVFLLSAAANESVHVAAEIERAVAKKKRVVTVRLERDVTFGPKYELHLAAAHWIDAWNVGAYELASMLLRAFRASDSSLMSLPAGTPPPSSTDDDERAPIDPKGPRSFDKEDAGYFLRLLPGPRGRDGLPEGARFWKQRVEATADTFSVGLVYGPSGCGKSSRVKAALLPRLAKTVIPIYFEATADGTEERLLRELRAKLPALPGALDLPEAMAALRRGQYLPAGHKVAVFVDQFEQWLHSRPEDTGGPLVEALRQCNGARVQCVIMIREDFWPAVNGFFMRALDVPLVEGVNARRIDLFTPRHARDVLVLFGQAMGALPAGAAEISPAQHKFLDAAVQGLAQDGKVVCVRLSLFAEMVRHKEWVPETLDAVGGIAGIGATFLDETFTAPNAPPQYRFHQAAAQQVLRALLPPGGSEIKGHLRSATDLLAASGYAHDPARFEDLLRVLDSELRLVTLADPGGARAARGTERHYQLTHDYLVPSLRDWLGRKQRETRRGRAELLLEERAADWNRRREARLLPSLAQWLQISWFVPRRNRTHEQHRMVRAARRHHLARLALVLLVAAGALYGGLVYRDRLQTEALHDRIIAGEPADATKLALGGERHRARLNPLLHATLARAEERARKRAEVLRNRELVAKWADIEARNLNGTGDIPKYKPDESAGDREVLAAAKDDTRVELNARLALLPAEAEQVGPLTERLLAADPTDVPALVDALEPHKGGLLAGLWATAEGDASRGAALRAAAALAKYDDTSPKWGALGARVVGWLVLENPIYLGEWAKVFAPEREKLIRPLQKVLRQPLRPPAAGDQIGLERQRDAEAAVLAAQKALAADLLLAFAGDRPDDLTEALLDSDEEQFPKFLAALRPHKSACTRALLGELRRTPDASTGAERAAKRSANAAVCLALFDDTYALDGVWKQLQWSADPRVRSYLIARLGKLGAHPKPLVERFAVEPDAGARRALLLALGGFPDAAFAPADRAALLTAARRTFDETPDPGLRAAAEWLLRANGAAPPVGAPADGEYARAAAACRAPGARAPHWFRTGEGHTMVAVPGPVTFTMGAPKGELGQLESEKQREQTIPRAFAVASKLTTNAQFRRFHDATVRTPPAGFATSGAAHVADLPADFRKHDEQPVVRATWNQVAAYCNWLTLNEGLTESDCCYTLDANGIVIGIPDDALQRRGYRLPTDAEMEYTNRAGAVTARFYGETEELLGEYAWYARNSPEVTRPVGTRKPNDFGLFDVQGNAFTWCHDRSAAPGERPGGAVKQEDKRVLRGGAFYFMAISLRAARRHDDVPTMQGLYYGFRVARTIR